MNFLFFILRKKYTKYARFFKNFHIMNNWKSTVADTIITIFQLIIIIKAIALN